MIVKTLKKHSNIYGGKYQKSVGYKYEHPTPTMLIKSGVIEKVKSENVVIDDKESSSDKVKNNK